MRVPSGFDAPRRPPPGTLLRFIEFEDATLLVAVNESSSDVTFGVQVSGGSSVGLVVPSGTGRLFILDPQNRVLDLSERCTSVPRTGGSLSEIGP